MMRSELTVCSYCRKYKLESEMWSRRVCMDCKPIADNKILEYENKKAEACKCQE